MSDGQARKRATLALDAPLHEFLGFSWVDEANPVAGLFVAPSARTLNGAGSVHAGTLATLIELAAYVSILPELKEHEQSVTHQFSAAYLAAADNETRLIARGEVLRRTGRVAFVAVSVRQADRLIASAQVTKSIVPGDAHGARR
jgi:uncharacterized protein (TIGR00369 family)